jgi:hypothetical protein
LEHAHGSVAARMIEELEAPALVVRADIERSVLLLAPHDRAVAPADTDRPLIRQRSAP